MQIEKSCRTGKKPFRAKRTKERIYCDNCGSVIGKKFREFSYLPFPISSARKGESAILCGDCCWHCGKEQCLFHCQETEDGKHIPDWGTLAPVKDYPRCMDIICRECGQSGSSLLSERDILWD